LPLRYLIVDRESGELKMYKPVADVMTRNHYADRIASICADHVGQPFTEVPKDFAYRMTIDTGTRKFILFVASA
jgi:hypothetical protein